MSDIHPAPARRNRHHEVEPPPPLVAAAAQLALAVELIGAAVDTLAEFNGANPRIADAPWPSCRRRDPQGAPR